MATDNKGIMVYLTPDLVDAIGQYCLDNGITRKIGDDEAAPSLGTGIAHYLKSTILNTVPLSPNNIVPTEKCNNNIGLSEKETTDLIEQYNNNSGLNEERVLDLIKEYNNNSGLSEERVTDLIEEKIATLPPTLSLLDIDRLIASAIESVITKNNAELTAMNTAWVEAKNEWWLSLEGVKNEHRQQIAHQHTEIARLRTMVDELMATNIESLTTTAIQPPNGAVKGWVEFCKMIGEPLPSKQIKDNTGELIKLAKSKGFGDWRYDSNKKRFNQQGGAGG